MPVTGLKREAEQAAESRTVGLLGRLGLVAKGVSYALVALLAIQVAVRGRGKPEGREEALAAIADERVGRGVLVVLAVGFAGYAIWRFADGLFDRHDEGRGAVGLGKRAGYVGLALFYAGLCALTVALLSGRESAGGSGEEEKATATVLEWPFGTWLVALVGGAFIAAAAANAYRALTRKFRDDLDTGEMSADEVLWYTRVGVAGHAARAVVFALIGAFLVKAAVEYDPKEAVGLDGALGKLAQQTHGTILLGVVAVGLLAYGAFCAVEARYRPV